MEQMNSIVESTKELNPSDVVNLINEILRVHSLSIVSEHVIKVAPTVQTQPQEVTPTVHDA
jgi:hypothetical protein